MNSNLDAKLAWPKLAYSPDEFADSTGLGRTTVYAEIKAMRLKARKVGTRTVITAEDARAYLASLPELRVA